MTVTITRLRGPKSGPEFEDTPFGFALLLSYCDDGRDVVIGDVRKKYGLSLEEAVMVTDAARNYISMKYRELNPKAFLKLGLSDTST